MTNEQVPVWDPPPPPLIHRISPPLLPLPTALHTQFYPETQSPPLPDLPAARVLPRLSPEKGAGEEISIKDGEICVSPNLRVFPGSPPGSGGSLVGLSCPLAVTWGLTGPA